jgi:rare lipoprotein A
MRKLVTGFILIAIFGFVYSQSPSVLKQKTVASKDTLKKTKGNLQPVLLKKDSLPVTTIKYKTYKKGGLASYYADKFTGKKTASGKKFDNALLTAAHKKLPFGTIVKVTNEANGKSVLVEINDRGPFVRTREIDLSKRAFMEIAQNSRGGQMKVTLEIEEK